MLFLIEAVASATEVGKREKERTKKRGAKMARNTDDGFLFDNLVHIVHPIWHELMPIHDIPAMPQY